MADVRSALIRQHYSTLTMLRQAIQRCPKDVWLGGSHPRNYWRIVYHAAFYVDLYLYENKTAYVSWEKVRKECTWLDGDFAPMPAYSKAEMLRYVDYIKSLVEPQIMAMDLDDPSCGFPWYPKVSRVELLILSLRHAHGHIGQLSEILIANDLDVDWIGQSKDS